MNTIVATNDPRWGKVIAWIAGVGGSLTVALLIWIGATLIEVKVAVAEQNARGQPLNQSVMDLSSKMGRVEDRVGNIEVKLATIEDRQKRALQ